MNKSGLHLLIHLVRREGQLRWHSLMWLQRMLSLTLSGAPEFHHNSSNPQVAQSAPQQTVCFQPELCTGRWAKPYSQRHSGSPVTCSAAKGVLLLWASDAHSAPATGGKEGSMLTLTCLHLPFLWVLPDRFTQNSGTGNIYCLSKFKDTALINGQMKSWKRGDALPSYEQSAVMLSVIVWMRNPHF